MNRTAKKTTPRNRTRATAPSPQGAKQCSTPRVVNLTIDDTELLAERMTLKTMPSSELARPIARISAVLPFFTKAELNGLADYLEAELATRLLNSPRERGGRRRTKSQRRP